MTCNEPIGEAGFCALPAGHASPMHGMHGELPEDVAKIVAEVMLEAEKAMAGANYWHHRYKRWTRFMMFAAGLNLIVALWGIVSAMTP